VSDPVTTPDAPIHGFEVGRFGCRHVTQGATGQWHIAHEAHTLRAVLTQIGTPGPAVIAVPGALEDAERRRARAEAEAAGFEVLRIVNVPMAAALAHGLAERTGRFAIFDLGEDAFDFRVVLVEDGVIEVRGAAAEAAVGGVAMDRAVACQLLAELGARADARAIQAMAAPARDARAALNTHFSVPFEATLPNGQTITRQLTRHQFGHCVQGLLDRLAALCHDALFEANLRTDELADVVLVGDGARAPWVRTFVSELFLRVPVAAASGAPAIGAAMLAQRLVSGADPVLLDGLSMTLGLESDDGYIARLLPRGAPFPASAERTRDGGVLKVFQGERNRAEDCRLVGNYTLPAQGGRVRFEIDGDGFVTVQARDAAGTLQTLRPTTPPKAAP
jgi:molecular chaperone DnaK